MFNIIIIISFLSDVDECSKGGFCTGGSCINTDGSYRCVCPEGRSVSPDGSSCVGKLTVMN